MQNPHETHLIYRTMDKARHKKAAGGRKRARGGGKAATASVEAPAGAPAAAEEAGGGRQPLRLLQLAAAQEQPASLQRGEAAAAVTKGLDGAGGTAMAAEEDSAAVVVAAVAAGGAGSPQSGLHEGQTHPQEGVVAAACPFPLPSLAAAAAVAAVPPPRPSAEAMAAAAAREGAEAAAVAAAERERIEAEALAVAAAERMRTMVPPPPPPLREDGEEDEDGPWFDRGPHFLAEPYNAAAAAAAGGQSNRFVELGRRALMAAAAQGRITGPKASLHPLLKGFLDRRGSKARAASACCHFTFEMKLFLLEQVGTRALWQHFNTETSTGEWSKLALDFNREFNTTKDGKALYTHFKSILDAWDKWQQPRAQGSGTQPEDHMHLMGGEPMEEEQVFLAKADEVCSQWRAYMDLTSDTREQKKQKKVLKSVVGNKIRKAALGTVARFGRTLSTVVCGARDSPGHHTRPHPRQTIHPPTSASAPTPSSCCGHSPTPAAGRKKR